MRILIRRGERKAKRRARRGSEGKESLQHGLHATRRLRKSILVHSRVREDLAEALKDVDGDLRGDADAVGQAAIWRRRARARTVVARAGRIDVGLHAGREAHGHGLEHEAERDARHGREADVQLAQQRVQAVRGEWEAEEDGDGVEVRHQVVGDAACLHVGGLGDGVAGELVLAEPVDDEGDAGGESEMVAGDQGRPLTRCARRLPPFSSRR